MKLHDILRVKRPSNSQSERWLADKISQEIGGELRSFGLFLSRSPDIAVVAHLDTVHKSEGCQKISFKGEIAYTKDGECLGADDGAGVYACIEIAKATDASVIMLYGEESGGIGARALLAEKIKIPDRLIEFDRKGELDCIYEHITEDCASHQFAKAISHYLGLRPSKDGCFTDVAQLCKISRECVNVSIGFHTAHTQYEYLNVRHTENIIKRFIKEYNNIKGISLSRIIQPEKKIRKRHFNYRTWSYRDELQRFEHYLVHDNAKGKKTNPCIECFRSTCSGCYRENHTCDDCIMYDCGSCNFYHINGRVS